MKSKIVTCIVCIVIAAIVIAGMALSAVDPELLLFLGIVGIIVVVAIGSSND